MQHGVIQPDGRLHRQQHSRDGGGARRTRACGMGWGCAPGVRVKMNRDGGACRDGCVLCRRAPAAVWPRSRRRTRRWASGRPPRWTKSSKSRTRRTRSRTCVIMGKYCVRNAHLPFEVDVSTIEQGFVVLLDPEFNIWYTGTPDVGKAVMQAAAVRTVVDTKSTGSYITAEYKNAGTGRPAR